MRGYPKGSRRNQELASHNNFSSCLKYPLIFLPRIYNWRKSFRIIYLWNCSRYNNCIHGRFFGTTDFIGNQNFPISIVALLLLLQYDACDVRRTESIKHVSFSWSRIKSRRQNHPQLAPYLDQVTSKGYCGLEQPHVLQKILIAEDQQQ